MRVGVATFVVWALTAAAVTAEPLRYTLSPMIENGRLQALAVEMVLTGEPDGDTVIELPDAWGGKSELWRAVSEFRVSGDGNSLAGAEPARKVIRHAPNAVLTIRYRISQHWAGEPRANNANEYRPVVRPTYFHVIGHSVFAKPAWSLAMKVTFEMKDFPSSWQLASDLQHQPAGSTLNLAELMKSITVGGDYRIVAAGKLRVAVRGAWSFSETDFIKRLEPIVASHHKFWGDPAEPYLVTLLPLLADPGHMSMGGTGLGDAFAFFATSNVAGEQFNRLLAHEHLHTWIPGRIGSMPLDDDSVDYWLSEGFTDFYTVRLMLRDGLWTLDEAVKNINGVMWDYGFSAARNLSNGRVARDFWTDQTAGQMPYLRGFLFAALADDRVRNANKGSRDLDDVVLAMKQEAAKADHGIPPLARTLFVAKMRALGVDIAPDIDRFIERGETIVLAEGVWAQCGTIATEDVAVFDRGFDGRRTIANGNSVVGVDPEGPAFRAGLRDGMRLRKLDLSEGGDSRRDLVYHVLEQDKQREIRYLPEGKRRVQVQELRLAPGLDGERRKACVARLGGL